QIIALEELVAMLAKPLVENGPICPLTAEKLRTRIADLARRLGRVDVDRKRHSRERAANILESFNLPLDLLDKLHAFEEVEVALLRVDSEHNFHRHKRPEMLLEPGVRLDDLRLPGE